MLTKQQKKEAKNAYTIMRYSNTAPAPLYLARANSRLADIGNGADPLKIKERCAKDKTWRQMFWFAKQRKLLALSPGLHFLYQVYPE